MALFCKETYEDYETDAWILIHAPESDPGYEYEIIPHADHFDTPIPLLECFRRTYYRLHKATSQCYIVAGAKSPEILLNEFEALKAHYMEHSEYYKKPDERSTQTKITTRHDSKLINVIDTTNAVIAKFKNGKENKRPRVSRSSYDQGTSMQEDVVSDEDATFVCIGPNKTKMLRDTFNVIKWTNHLGATRILFKTIFGPDVLAGKYVEQSLETEKVEDIVHVVTSLCKISRTTVTDSIKSEFDSLNARRIEMEAKRKKKTAPKEETKTNSNDRDEPKSETKFRRILID